MRLCKAQCAVRVNVDLLAAGDFGVLVQWLVSLFDGMIEGMFVGWVGTYQGATTWCENGLVAWWTVLDHGRAVGLCLAA